MPTRALVGVLDQFQRVAIRVGEVHPAPARKHPVIHHVDIGVEPDALGLQASLRRPDVFDNEGDMAGAHAVGQQRPLGVRGRGAVLQQFQHGVAEPQANLSQRCARHADPMA